MITTFEQLLQEAGKKDGIVVGVPAPEDSSSIETVIQAKKDKIADFILCGDKGKIISLLEEHGGNPDDFEILDGESFEDSATKIVELANRNKVHVILKGFLPTASLMKPILDKEKGLRTGNLLSDVMMVENPLDNFKGLLGVTDGGLNILPDLKQKEQIIENAVKVYHKLGVDCPKVGVLAASEKVKDAMPATVDAQALTEMNKNGEISGCEVYGPLALDIAVSPEAAEHKGVNHPVAGYAQILVVPSIEVGNVFGKSFTYYHKLPVCHVVMGARIPILIPSRNDTEVDKIHSVALGVICAEC